MLGLCWHDQLQDDAVPMSKAFVTLYICSLKLASQCTMCHRSWTWQERTLGISYRLLLVGWSTVGSLSRIDLWPLKAAKYSTVTFVYYSRLCGCHCISCYQASCRGIRGILHAMVTTLLRHLLYVNHESLIAGKALSRESIFSRLFRNA